MDKMDGKKKDMLEALQLSMSVISTACERVGISRQTHYNWIRSDPEYKEQCESLEQRTVDMVESHLYKLIRDGNPAATIFFLKTKGKGRGYVERQEIAVAEKKPLSWFTDDNADVS